MYKKVLFLIDDDPDDIDLFEMALTKVDSTSKVISVSDGQSAVNQLTEELIIVPDLIFLDLNMPGMDGKQCLVKLRESEHLEKIPIIMFTTSDYEKDIEETMRLGASYFQTKPTQFDALCNAIRSILEREW